MSKQLARIKGVNFGVGDYGRVCLWFSAYISESEAALQVLELMDAAELIKAAGVRDVHQLEGHNVWVEADGRMILYQGYAKI